MVYVLALLGKNLITLSVIFTAMLICSKWQTLNFRSDSCKWV